MVNALISVVALAVIAVVIGAMAAFVNRGRPIKTKPAGSLEADTIGRTVGMLGGNITDAAVVQYALQAKEEATGQPATQRDAIIAAEIRKAVK